jgi:hypothetical protein
MAGVPHGPSFEQAARAMDDQRAAAEEDGRNMGERIAALHARRSKSPSHVEEMRTAIVAELIGWTEGHDIDPWALINAVETYDNAKRGGSNG